MAQYKTGSVNVTNGSVTVVGVGTAFLINVAIGNSIKVAGIDVTYQVASVLADDQLTLSAPYQGATANNAAYQVGTGFTDNFSLVEIDDGDNDWPYHLTAGVIRPLDTILKAIASSNFKTTEPAIKFAGMPWADATSGYMKFRNTANTAWISAWKLDGSAGGLFSPIAGPGSLQAFATGALTATSVITSGDGRVGSATTIYNARFEVIKGAAAAYETVGDEFTQASANKTLGLGTGGYRNVITINASTGSVAATRSTTGLLLNSFYSSNAYAAASLLVNCNTGNGTIHFYTGAGSVETPIERAVISSTGLAVTGAISATGTISNTKTTAVLADAMLQNSVGSCQIGVNSAGNAFVGSITTDKNFLLYANNVLKATLSATGLAVTGIVTTTDVLTVGTTNATSVIQTGGTNTHLYLKAVGAAGSVVLVANGTNIATASPVTGFSVTGLTTTTTLRINTAPTDSAATASTHKVAVNLNGTAYYLLATT